MPSTVEIDKVATAGDSLELKSLKHIISKGIDLEASDIHIEPRGQIVWVRYRVGDSLLLGTKLPIHTMEKLAHITKEMGNLNVKHSDRPQAGNFEISLNGERHDLSLSTMPVIDGEKIVLHVRHSLQRTPTLEDMGFWGDNLETIKSSLAKLNGMIVFASSSRSANAATLFTIAKILNQPTLRVVTVEDPIIYRIDHALQLEVSDSNPFANQMIVASKLEPNVLILGNIPDSKTADIAFRSSHKSLVCAYLNTNDAVSALQLLKRIEVDQTDLVKNLKIVVGQTMVKRLCRNCRESLAPSPHFKKNVSDYLGSLTDLELHDLEKKARDTGLGKDLPLSINSDLEITRLWKANDKGCDQCNYTGYKEYVLVSEVLNVTKPTIRSLMGKPIQRNGFRKSSGKDSLMVPKSVDALIKCMRGIIDYRDIHKSL